MAGSRRGSGKVKARSRKGQGKVECQGQGKINVKLNQNNHNPNHKFNLIGFDTTEINIVSNFVDFVILAEGLKMAMHHV